MTDSRKERVYDYWNSAASKLSDGGRKATSPDALLQGMIEQAIIDRLGSRDTLLDIGCGDGTSTLKFSKICSKVVGVDYVEKFVDLARQNNAAENVVYDRANVLELSSVKKYREKFDVVSTIRCLINLDSWESQVKGLSQVADIVVPGGLYLASEGWADGLDGLNERRLQCGLEPISVIHHNKFIYREQFREAAENFFEVEEYVSLGLYFYLSRVVQPLMVRPNPPSYDHSINIAAVELQRCTKDAERFFDLDYAGIYVLRRKSE